MEGYLCLLKFSITLLPLFSLQLSKEFYGLLGISRSTAIISHPSLPIHLFLNIFSPSIFLRKRRWFHFSSLNRSGGWIQQRETNFKWFLVFNFLSSFLYGFLIIFLVIFFGLVCFCVLQFWNMCLVEIWCDSWIDSLNIYIDFLLLCLFFKDSLKKQLNFFSVYLCAWFFWVGLYRVLTFF